MQVKKTGEKEYVDVLEAVKVHPYVIKSMKRKKKRNDNKTYLSFQLVSHSSIWSFEIWFI